MDIAIITSSIHETFHKDDIMLSEALKGYGYDTHIICWDNADINWKNIRFCIIRSTWDSFFRHKEFLNWAERISKWTNLWNPLYVIKWNINKKYLIDLSNRGVKCVSTQLVASNNVEDLKEEIFQFDYKKVVIKPAVSLGALDTYYMDIDDPISYESNIDNINSMLLAGEILLQPYLPSVKIEGELSLIYIGGHFSHAIEKHPAPSDFRVQEIYGGKYKIVEPDKISLDTAEQAFKEIGFERLLYARVDLIKDDNGLPLIIELEFIDPDLFLQYHKIAVKYFADAIITCLDNRF